MIPLSTIMTPEGLRGVIARDWTYDLVRGIARRVCSAISSDSLFPEAKQRGLILGYDTRFLSDRYAEALAETVCRSLPAAVISEPVSLPHFSYRIREKGFGLGLYVTGGILPPDYSGVVFLGSDGSYLSETALKAILDSMPVPAEDCEPGCAIPPAKERPARSGARSAYGEALLMGASLRSALGWRREILIDVNHGATEADFMAALTRTGLYFRVLKNARDVLFGGRTPDLSHQTVPVNHGRSTGPFLVLAVDPTGQRLSATDSAVSWVPPEILLPCLLRALADTSPEPFTVVRTQATTHWVEDLLRGSPARFVECPPGPGRLSRAVLSESARWGMDESGCLVDARHLPVPDAVHAAIALLEVLAETDGSLSQWIKQFVSSCPPPIRRTLEFRLDPPSIRALLNGVRRSPLLQWLDFPLVKATDRGGIKFVFQGGRWIYFYPRFIESRVEVVFETPNAEEAEPMEDRLLEITSVAGVMKE